MRYDFLIDSYETEQLKVLSVWTQAASCRNLAPPIYAYSRVEALLEGERGGGRKTPLPVTSTSGEIPVTERSGV